MGHVSVGTVLSVTWSPVYTSEQPQRQKRNTCECQLLNDFLTITMCPQGMLPHSLSSGGRSRTDVYPVSPHRPPYRHWELLFLHHSQPYSGPSPCSLCMHVRNLWKWGFCGGVWKDKQNFRAPMVTHHFFWRINGYIASQARRHKFPSKQVGPSSALVWLPRAREGCWQTEAGQFLVLTLPLSWWSFLARPLILNHTNASPWPSAPSFSVPSADLTGISLWGSVFWGVPFNSLFKLLLFSTLVILFLPSEFEDCFLSYESKKAILED